MKNKKSTIILLVSFFVGLSVLLYPAISSYWNSKTQSEIILDYEAMLANIEADDYTALFEEAEEYNKKLSQLASPHVEHEKVEGYLDVLDVTGTGMMGYITIPKISQEIPVYHGTSEEVLSVAVGHYQGSSLPIGGESTHSVVSAHRGMPTATLFTYLDRMEVGDLFYYTVLDRKFTYEVDQIRIVEPDDTSLVQIEEGKDYSTLVTCTPFGLNTQRLLVRGHQIDVQQTRNIYIANEAYRVDHLIVMPIVALPIIFVLLIYVMFAPVKKESLGED